MAKYKDGKLIFRFRIILAFIIGKYGTETLTTTKRNSDNFSIHEYKKQKIESLQQRRRNASRVEKQHRKKM